MPRKIQPKGHSKSRKVEGPYHKSKIVKICVRNLINMSNSRRIPITIEWIRKAAKKSNVDFKEVLSILKQKGFKLNKIAGE
jgi:hypothetical protein